MWKSALTGHQCPIIICALLHPLIASGGERRAELLADFRELRNSLAEEESESIESDGDWETWSLSRAEELKELRRLSREIARLTPASTDSEGTRSYSERLPEATREYLEFRDRYAEQFRAADGIEDWERLEGEQAEEFEELRRLRARSSAALQAEREWKPDPLIVHSEHPEVLEFFRLKRAERRDLYEKHQESSPEERIQALREWHRAKQERLTRLLAELDDSSN